MNIFLDNASTTPVSKEVLEAMLPYFTKNFGNASGMHSFSRNAKEGLERARKEVAEILNCEPTEIIFTSGGTESDNLAIFGSIEANATKNKNHIITSKIEHPAVLHSCEKLEKKNFSITFLSPNREGEILPETLQKAITQKTVFVSLMYANNELGTINDIPSLSKIAKEKNIIFHTDACQAVLTETLDTKKLGIDLMSLNGSKIYGPKGIGVLFKKKGIKIAPQMIGGAQEMGLRAGTENVAFAVGFATALKLAQKNKERETKRQRALQKKIIEFVKKEIPLSLLNGPQDLKKRLPHNIHFSFLNTEGESLLLFLDQMGFALATGSACSTANLEPSHVLTGIGMPHEIAHGSLRITLGKNTKKSDIGRFLPALKIAVKKVREISSCHFTEKDFKEWF